MPVGDTISRTLPIRSVAKNTKLDAVKVVAERS